MAQREHEPVEDGEHWAITLRREQLRNDPEHRAKVARLRKERSEGKLGKPVGPAEIDEFFRSILGR